MEIMRFGKYHEPEECPVCNESLWNYCEKCGQWKEKYCPNCGEDLGAIEAFIAFTTDKYHGTDRMSSYTATLLLDGKAFAYAHIDTDESDSGDDVAYLQLAYIGTEHQTQKIADIIADFAKWVRFDWKNFDKQSELPTLVRLLGFITHKDRAFPNQLERFTALQDATKINAKHLLWDFTSREAD